MNRIFSLSNITDILFISQLVEGMKFILLISLKKLSSFNLFKIFAFSSFGINIE